MRDALSVPGAVVVEAPHTAVAGVAVREGLVAEDVAVEVTVFVSTEVAVLVCVVDGDVTSQP